MGSQAPYAQEFFVLAEANPFGMEWVELKNLYKGQPSEYDSGAVRGFAWWNFTVNVLGESYFIQPENPTSEELRVLQQQSRNAGNRVSMLKIEVEYTQGNAKVRRFRMDIGAGVDIFIPPAHQVRARILGPTLDSVPPELPPSFARNVQLASTLIVTAQCVNGPVNRPISTYTQAVAVRGGQNPLVEIQEGAKRAQVLATFPLSGRVNEMLIQRDNAGAILNMLSIGDIEPVFVGGFQTRVAQLSGPTTHLQMVGAGDVAQAASVIQLLEF